MGETPPSDQVPRDVDGALAAYGIWVRDEVGLRLALEEHLKGYTLYRLTPAAARRWKCQYRIMFEATYFDCQTVAEAYARALLASLPASP
ncbi:MAG TPA: hypothetical protein VH591_17985 [Ktedonobacterales bacterium]